MPDVFDQLPAAAPAAPQGDIFDHVAATQPQALPDVSGSGMARALAQANAVNARGLTPLDLASNQYQLDHPASAPQTSAFQNAGAAAFHVVGDPLGNAALRAGNRIGLVSDQTLQNAVANPLFRPDMNRVSGVVGAGLGQAGEAVALGGMAPAAFALQAGENEKESIEARQAAGEQIDPWRQAGDVAGQAALAYGLGKLAPGGTATKSILGAAGKAIPGMAGKIAVGAGMGMAENAGQQVGGNLIRRFVGGDQNQSVTEGVPEALESGAVFGAGGQAAHEVIPNLLARLRAKRTAEQGAKQPASLGEPAHQVEEQKPQQGNQDEQTPPHQLVENVHTSENRQEAAPAEPKETIIPASEYRLPPKGPSQAGEEYVNRSVQDKVGGNLTPTEQAEIARRPALAQDQAKTEGEHPARLADENALTAWYKQHNPNDATGDLIGTMAGHTPYALADVPHEFAKPLTDEQGGDVDRNKIEGLKNLTDEQHAQLKPSILGPDGEVFDGNHRVIAAQEAGRSIRAYVPEHLIGQYGIKEAGEGVRNVGTSEQVPTQQKLSEAEQRQANAARLRATNKQTGKATIPDFAQRLAERDVKPSILKTLKNAKQSWDSINRFIGSGANLNETNKDTATTLREADAKREVDQARTETAMKPFRDILSKMTDKERTEWVDQVEGTGGTGPLGQAVAGTSTRKDLQALADMNHAWNQENIKEGKKYGLDTSKWDSNWIGHLAEFPEKPEPGTGGKTRNTIAGGQKFLKKRTYDTFGEFKQAVEDAGGKLKYDNPADMLLAKQMEVRRSIDARKLLYQQEAAGQLHWVPEGARPPEGSEAKLTDPLAKQERDVVAPKWMVSKLLNMKHADAEKYMQSAQWRNRSQLLRPGDAMPAGFSKTGETVAGQYHADPNAAGLFNSLVNPGLSKDVPILSQIAAARRRVTAANLALPAAHGALTVVGNAVKQMGAAMEAARYGKWGLAAKAGYRAINPAASAEYGKAIREQAADPNAHPELEPVVQTSMKGGNKFDLKSVLNKTAFEKAKDEWTAGNKAGALPRFASAVYHKVEAPVFEHFVPDVKAAAKGAAAELAIARGLSGQELSRRMALHEQDVNNVLGMVKRSDQFQHRILTDAMDVVFSAPKFVEGTFRHAGAFGRDTIKAFNDMAHGKAPDITPAHYTALAGLLTHMTGAALIQLAYTTATTGKPVWPTGRDYFTPRTGRKDDKGRDERVTLLTPFSSLAGFTKHGVGAGLSHVGELWRTGKAFATNVDDRGREIGTAGDRAKYLGRHMLPFSIQNMMDIKDSGEKVTWDRAALNAVGSHLSHDYASDAANAAHQAVIDRMGERPMSKAQADKSDMENRLRQEIHDKNPQARADVQAAVKAGRITAQDSARLFKPQAEGLRGLLKEVDADDLMKKVWPRMTPQERQENQWIIRGKIGRSKSLSPAAKQALWNQIKTDVQGVK